MAVDKNNLLFLLYKLHRRLLYDDNLGVGEALNETGADGKGLIARGGVFFYNSPLYMFIMVVKNVIHLFIYL